MAEGPSRISPMYINRELSWLDFNERVLALAENGFIPLRRRVKGLILSVRKVKEKRGR